MIYFFVILVVSAVFAYLLRKKEGPKQDDSFVTAGNLQPHVAYYRALEPLEKTRFETRVKAFLSAVKVTGVDTPVSDTDRLLVAASAVIPVFAFQQWYYPNLDEVLLYSDHINEDFQTKGESRNIMGMVGSGYMEGKMLLSRAALELGFANSGDKANTAIHEFVHLVDKLDGDTDGVPLLLMDKQYVIPWLDMIHKKMKEIIEGRSDINPYGITNQAEFFAVASEYFFERPDILQDKHPDLYNVLQQVFRQEPGIDTSVKKKTGRNDPCPCGSGKKYKECCMTKEN